MGSAFCREKISEVPIAARRQQDDIAAMGTPAPNATTGEFQATHTLGRSGFASWQVCDVVEAYSVRAWPILAARRSRRDQFASEYVPSGGAKSGQNFGELGKFQ